MSSYCFYNADVYTGYARMNNCSVFVNEGRIIDVFYDYRFDSKIFPPHTQFFDVGGLVLAPGFIDTHIHGFYGYGVEDASQESILKMSEHLAQFGVTSFCPTIYPQPMEKFLKIISACSSAIGKEKGARILGLHLEGPFISSKKLGAQLPEAVQMPSIEIVDRLWEASEGKILNMTVAPELKGMHEVAIYCQNKGIKLQAGHTNASYENIKEGVQVGIVHATHFFNAMSPLHHRDPNAIGAILINPDYSVEIIADGHHVHPDLIKLVLRNKSFEKVILVTDALKPTEQKEGSFVANGEAVYLDKTGVFHKRVDDVIAGSSLTMIKGVKNLVDFGLSLRETISMSSLNPATIMKIEKKGALLPGYDADLVIFDKEFNIVSCMVEGDFKVNKIKNLKKT